MFKLKFFKQKNIQYSRFSHKLTRKLYKNKKKLYLKHLNFTLNLINNNHIQVIKHLKKLFKFVTHFQTTQQKLI